MNEELDSQLSAMFDDELPAPQCELLARRLSRDEALKARWGRYATIGAALRAERSVALDGALARRVSQALAEEPPLIAGALAEAGARPGRGFLRRWAQPFVAGTGVAAAVAAGAIFWVRAEAPLGGAYPGAAVASMASTLAQHAGADSYTTPVASEQAPTYAPPAELANYVVAHSEFSAPFLRRNMLSALVTAESANAQAAAREVEERIDNRTPHALDSH
jgi:sigma-E factor negative regulatory protein RseA